MSERPLNVLCVIGTSAASSATHAVIGHIAQGLNALGDDVDVFDPNEESLPLFNPQSSYSLPGFVSLKKRVERADAYVFGTPDYHGSVSSTLKNFLDHFWHEFAGKLFAQVVCSHEKGLTVIDQLRTVARQCYAWSLPYGISFSSPGDVKEGKIIEALDRRIEMLVHDLHVYGTVLRRQREIDLAGTFPTFLAAARHAKKPTILKTG
jgi:NAD(P)H-dependent FMN reductase